MLATEQTDSNLAHKIYDTWKDTPRGKYWSYLEVLQLTRHFLKLCQEQEKDYQEFDFSSMLDITLTYQENRMLIEENLGQSQEQSDKEYYDKLIAEAQPELNALEENEKFSSKNNQLEHKVSKLKEDLQISEAQKKAIINELEKLKNQHIAANQVAVKIIAENVQIQQPQTTTQAEPKTSKLKATKLLLSDLYWAILKN